MFSFLNLIHSVADVYSMAFKEYLFCCLVGIHVHDKPFHLVMYHVLIPLLSLFQLFPIGTVLSLLIQK